MRSLNGPVYMRKRLLGALSTLGEEAPAQVSVTLPELFQGMENPEKHFIGPSSSSSFAIRRRKRQVYFGDFIDGEWHVSMVDPELDAYLCTHNEHFSFECYG